jgi:hypothetical protein
VAFKIPNICDFVTKLGRQQAQVIQNHNGKVRNTGKGEVQHRKYRTLRFGEGKTYEISSA